MNEANITMKVIRNQHDLRKIKDLLVPDTDVPSEDVFKHIAESLRTRPGDVYTILAEDVEDESPVLFIVALHDPTSAHAFIHQAWATPETQETSIPDQAFLAVVLWAKGRGVNVIRMETRRSPGAFQKRWGFKEASKVMEYNVQNDLLKKLVDGKHKELINQGEDNGQ